MPQTTAHKKGNAQQNAYATVGGTGGMTAMTVKGMARRSDGTA
jgi:hypothetical protein